MARQVRIGYFLEDIAQERFLLRLVERIATGEMTIPPGTIQHEIRNARRGSVVWRALDGFLRDTRAEWSQHFHVLIVAIDGNCRIYQKTRGSIQEKVDQAGYVGRVCCAVPNPHIERWYMLDRNALRQILGVEPEPPPYKCERYRYKNALTEALNRAGISPPLGGAEYGGDVAEASDIYAVGREDRSFKHFIDDLQESLRPYSPLAGTGRESHEDEPS